METDIKLSPSEVAELCKNGEYQTLEAGLLSQSLSGLSKVALKSFKDLQATGTTNQRVSILLAVLHTVADAELQKLRFWPGYINSDVVRPEFLRAVPRARLQTFANLLLEQGGTHWPSVWTLYKEGMVDKPRTNGYVAGLIRSCSWSNKNRDGLQQMLRAKPEFLAGDVWLLFEFDGTAEDCLASSDKYLTNASETWASVLVGFANDNSLDRVTLLQASLKALSRDFNQFRAGWFSRFHEALKPTVDERNVLCDQYLQLLSSPIPPTVSMAIEALKAINSKKGITFDRLSDNVGGALTAKSKQTALMALSLLESAAERESQNVNKICSIACGALASSHTDVQQRVLDLLTKFGSSYDPELTATLQGYQPAVSLSLQKKYAKLFSQQPGALPNAVAKNAVRATVEPRQVQQLFPVADLEQLILDCSFVLENPINYNAYELVLDGISRLCLERPADFAKRTSALLQRATKLHAKTEETTVRFLALLIIVWITGSLPDAASQNRWVEQNALTELQRLRVEAIIQRVLKHQCQQLLSRPTSDFGWIDQAELLTRLQSANKGSIDRLDLVIGLLRARNAERPLLDFAAQLSKDPTVTFAIQVAASSSDVHSPVEPTYSWEIVHQKSGDYEHSHIRFLQAPWSVFPSRLDPALVSFGEADQRPFAGFSYGRFGSSVLLGAGSAPNLRESVYGIGVAWLSRCFDSVEVPDKVSRFYLHHMNDPSHTPGPMGSLLLTVGLSMADVDIATAAKDVFIRLIDEDRLNIKETGDAMHKLFHDGKCIKGVRWAKNFGDASKVSSKHSLVVLNLMQHVLSNSSAVPPKDIHNVLELLVELCATHECVVAPSTADYLRSVKMGGKTGKLVQTLLAD